jgi:hypothetical protein
MSNKQSPDEIDITQFFRWIGSGFKRFGNGIIQGMARFRNTFLAYRKFFFFLIGLSLVGGGIYSTLVRKKHYESSMIVSSEYMNLQVLQSTFSKLNLLSMEKERKGLSEQLGIDMATAKNIIEFEVESFVSENDKIEMQILKEQLNNTIADKKDLVEKVMRQIQLNNQHSFKINIKVYDPEIVKPLEEAIVTFLRSNDYVKKRIESNESTLIARKAKLLRESVKLDSLKAVIYENFQTMAQQPREGSNNVILSDKYLADPMSVYSADLTLNNEILAIDRELQVEAYFEVVDGLTTIREPASQSTALVLIQTFLGSILLGYILIGLWRFNRYLAKLEPMR